MATPTISLRIHARQREARLRTRPICDAFAAQGEVLMNVRADTFIRVDIAKAGLMYMRSTADQLYGLIAEGLPLAFCLATTPYAPEPDPDFPDDPLPPLGLVIYGVPGFEPYDGLADDHGEPYVTGAEILRALDEAGNSGAKFMREIKELVGYDIRRAFLEFEQGPLVR